MAYHFTNSYCYFQVEELASLIKDNLSCKHLVLSVEEALVNFLQDDTRFAHESVGEGDYRHLVLERCADTTMYDIFFCVCLEEASYQAARARIFSLHEDGEQDLTAPKSRKVPVVARRMIAHALGQRISPTSSTEKLSLNESEKEVAGGLSSEEGKNLCPKVEDIKESIGCSTSKLGSHGRKKYDKTTHGSSGGRSHNSDGHNEGSSGVSAKNNLLPNANNRRAVGAEDLEKLHIGAARRIFAHALGLPSGKGNLETMVKPIEGNKDFKGEDRD
ncbi:hypothetical protein B296_00023830 [Ensete ventricosum]|uniref:R3H domain-containing protein n=1 Tax=Ensete ventricosum TaxID=4639 RepID=A0A426YWL3_ENSVE|nr:hypothetical protein B296_00023830 [Ensete ventricosum]